MKLCAGKWTRLRSKCFAASFALFVIPGAALAQDGEPSTTEAERDEVIHGNQDPFAPSPEPSAEPSAEAQGDPAPQPELTTIAVEPLQAEPTPAPAAEEPGAQLDDIVVTATKREKTEREIPASITAVSGDKLERLGIQSVEEIARLVPGVNITQPGDSSARITIRGIASQSGTNATTGVLFGDVSFTDTYLPRVTLDPNPFDLQSVEVLKGPQGTLFGAGALNGALRYVPAPPVFGVWEAKYFAQYTTLTDGGGGLTYGGAVNLPFGGDDQFALRAVATDRRAPGWIDNTQVGEEDANWIDQTSARGILAWQPGDSWDLRLTYAWQDTHAIETPIADNEDGRLEAGNKPRLSPSSSVYDMGALRIGYLFSGAQLISETAYISKEADNFFDGSSRLPAIPGVPTMAQEDTSHSETLSQELRLVSDEGSDSRWSWVTGVAAWRQDLFYRLEVPLTTPGVDLIPGLGALIAGLPAIGPLFTEDGNPSVANLEVDVTVKEIAFFADVTRKLGESWELSLGGRLYRTSSGGTAMQSGAALFAVNGTPERVIDDTIREQGFNPKASLLWHVSDQVLAYTAASRGFRVGGIQPGYGAPGGTPPPDTFKSDTLWNYEAGVRTQWFRNTLRLDLTGFFTTWKDPQTFQLGSTGVGSYIDNVGGVESKGGEAALQWLLPIPGMSLTAAAAYTDAATTEAFTASDGSTVEPGTPWTFAPKWQTATTLAQILPLGDWLLSAGATHSYLSKATNDLSTSPDAQGNPIKHEVFGFAQWDLQFALNNPAVAWMPELSFIVNNLTDERGVTNYWRSGVVDTTDVTYIRPRAFTLRLSGHF